MKYIGNKTRLLDFIAASMEEARLPKQGTFIDIFGGTGSVGSFFKRRGFRVISNDIMSYSATAQRVLVGLNTMPDFSGITSSGLEGVLKILNDQQLQAEGYAYENYSPGGKFGRQYFSSINAKRIDAVRDLIEQWYRDNRISPSEYDVLVFSLVDAADFVANISGTYGAFLKIWRSMALKPLILKAPDIYDNGLQNEVFQLDSNELIRNIHGDILYLDPPYNERQYAPNFHVLESITVWDKPELKGKTGQRAYEDKKSLFCRHGAAGKALKDLVDNADVSYIVMSYNNEGIIPRDELLQILQSVGCVSEYRQDYRRFRTERDSDTRHYKQCDDKVVEHLYIVQKQ